jgi:hypothetical protein
MNNTKEDRNDEQVTASWPRHAMLLCIAGAHEEDHDCKFRRGNAVRDGRTPGSRRADKVRSGK